MPDLAVLNLQVNSQSVTAATGALNGLSAAGTNVTQQMQNIQNVSTNVNNVFRLNASNANAASISYMGLYRTIRLLFLAYESLRGLGKVLELGADQEAAIARLSRFTGGLQTAAMLYGQLRQFAQNSPFNLPEIEKTTEKLLGYSFALKDIPNLLKVIGDTASAFEEPAKTMDHITHALGLMQSEQKVTARGFNELASAGVTGFKYLADAAGLTEQQMQKLVTKGVLPANEVIRILLQGMQGQYGGQQANYMQTFWGQWDNFSGKFLEEMTRLGAEALKDIDWRAVFKETIPIVHEIVDLMILGLDTLRLINKEVRSIVLGVDGIKASDFNPLWANTAANSAVFAHNMFLVGPYIDTMATVVDGMRLGFAVIRDHTDTIAKNLKAVYYFWKGDISSGISAMMAGPSNTNVNKWVAGELGGKNTNTISGLNSQIQQVIAIAEPKRGADSSFAALAQYLDDAQHHSTKLYEEESRRMQLEISQMSLTKNAAEQAHAAFKIQDEDIKEFNEVLPQTIVRIEMMRKQLDLLQNARELRKVADEIGNSFGSAFEDAIFSAKKLTDIIKNLVTEIEKAIVRPLVIRPLSEAIGSGITGAGQSLFPSIFGNPNASGGAQTVPGIPGNSYDEAGMGIVPVNYLGSAWSHGIKMFGHGGIFGSPTMFGMAGGGMGMLGERGPEAIVPLKRGRDGSLGIAGGSGGTVVHMTVYANDAGSFRKSRAQIARDLKGMVRR